MKKKLREMADKVVNFHQELYHDFEDLKNEISNCLLKEDLADAAYFMHEINNHLEEMAKQARQAKTVAEAVVGKIAIAMSDAEPIRTDYCTASIQIKSQPVIPHHKKDPEGFAEVMRWLEIPEEVWNCEEPTINIRWNGIVDAVNKAAEEGRPMPKCIDVSKYPNKYSLRFRRKQDITEDPPVENGDPF